MVLSTSSGFISEPVIESRRTRKTVPRRIGDEPYETAIAITGITVKARTKSMSRSFLKGYVESMTEEHPDESH